MAQHPVTNPPTGAAAGGGRIRAALKCAFPYTIPIFAGFWFLGMTYGIYMNVSGFSFWYPLLMSLTIFGGSLEFVAVSMLLAPYAPVQCFLMALMIQARHLFYGIAMLDKFKGLGWKKPWFYFFVTLLNQFYWVASATLGGVLGSFIHFNTEGLDFVMTAMFVVIFLEQWLKEKHHASEWIGLAASVGCLLLFGADNFLVPTMICILAALTALRRPLEKERGVTAP